MSAATGHRRNTWDRLTRPRIPHDAGEDRLPHAHPRLVSPAGRRHRPACEQVIGELLADHALDRLRTAQGIIGPARRHDRSRLEAACEKALAAGDPSCQTIKGVLAARAGGMTSRLPPPGTAGRRRSCASRRRSRTSSPRPARPPATTSPRDHDGRHVMTSLAPARNACRTAWYRQSVGASPST
jgi:hypothetical protein